MPMPADSLLNFHEKLVICIIKFAILQGFFSCFLKEIDSLRALVLHERIVFIPENLDLYMAPRKLGKLHGFLNEADPSFLKSHSSLIDVLDLMDVYFAFPRDFHVLIF